MVRQNQVLTSCADSLVDATGLIKWSKIRKSLMPIGQLPWNRWRPIPRRFSLSCTTYRSRFVPTASAPVVATTRNRARLRQASAKCPRIIFCIAKLLINPFFVKPISVQSIFRNACIVCHFQNISQRKEKRKTLDALTVISRFKLNLYLLGAALH